MQKAVYVQTAVGSGWSPVPLAVARGPALGYRRLGQQPPTPAPAPAPAPAQADREPVSFIDSPFANLVVDALGMTAAGIIGHTLGKAKMHRWSVFFWVLAGVMGVKGAIDLARMQ